MGEVSRQTLAGGKSLALGDQIPAPFLVIAADLDGENWLQLARALQHAFWEEAKDIVQPDVRRAVVAATGFNGTYLLSPEQDKEIQEKWRNDRETAAEKVS